MKLYTNEDVGRSKEIFGYVKLNELPREVIDNIIYSKLNFLSLDESLRRLNMLYRNNNKSMYENEENEYTSEVKYDINSKFYRENFHNLLEVSKHHPTQFQSDAIKWLDYKTNIYIYIAMFYSDQYKEEEYTRVIDGERLPYIHYDYGGILINAKSIDVGLLINIKNGEWTGKVVEHDGKKMLEVLDTGSKISLEEDYWVWGFVSDNPITAY